ncbi:hypothetical protein PS627_00267 [Pseudomonas fluorescens]|uniref:hypothetical protein n=1 Tax=Pseudomonas fluorescens TaxID=294 RepID=UPI001252EBC6|nr:hypothetical protein [Pseudomonas fluorescens]CAG8863331.1 hypothetical protein PS627_00267 [Pseudomonas fluorescens]
MKGFIFLLLGALGASAASAETAQTSTAWTLQDQFDNPYSLSSETRVLLIARSMSSARLVNRAVEDKPKGFLDTRGVVFVADIEMMPAPAKWILLPTMRSASYRILLDRDGKVADQYAGDRNSVQWLELKDGKVAREQRFTDLDPLQRALAALP